MKYKSKEPTPPEPEVITPVVEVTKPVLEVKQEPKPILEAKPEVVVPVPVPTKRTPARMTLFNALNRMAFDPDPAKNYAFYMKKRRGHEGKERTYLVTV
jgi:hypothetical protein